LGFQHSGTIDAKYGDKTDYMGFAVNELGQPLKAFVRMGFVYGEASSGPVCFCTPPLTFSLLLLTEWTQALDFGLV
jgi:hypothetical protein